MRKFIKDGKLPYIILSIMALLFALPLLWVIFASFDVNATQAFKIPTDWTIGNYINVLQDKLNQQAFGVGLLISAIEAVLVVLIAGLAAYPLSRYELRYKKMFMYTILLMTSLPITAVMVPVYKLFLSMNLYDSIFGVIIFMTASALPFAIWLMKNFMDSVPIELEEAAWVDGANVLTSIRLVIAPLMLPGVLVVMMVAFTTAWGNFLVPYILLNTVSKYPVSVKLYQFFGQNGLVVYGELAAYSVIYATPAVILYILSQKYMSQGFIMSGAAKG
ncbi:sugar ABC transporter permease [Vallitalea longa]|uniref:Sugar ABC transporter permease n=1 Tax=Vallitalea longa TaxID=2936439 RepID=A0A9W6DDU0_9FIRM|nr:carbohydrate ABC transporter permease [Vallitalea longa]GKX27663.1 sugar ABC transporter permease [Vallitalea longa]